MISIELFALAVIFLTHVHRADLIGLWCANNDAVNISDSVALNDSMIGKQ
jgi:hypothetical protein